MAIQGQNAIRPQGVVRNGNMNGASLNSGMHYVARIQLNDQFSCGNDYAMKVRKPYTITKQRERWTDEEHKKFLEALKLYGRAWRRIEEHIGTKTAVQIRSHAQKFFSKIVRDSNGDNTTLEESIEIPPPRPKRKPVHPYPRKLVEIRSREIPNFEQPLRSNSLKSSDFGHENKSPKSVLSALVSETLGSSDSDTLTGSLSPVSSISGVHTNNFSLAEPKTSYEEKGSPSPSHDEQPIVKLKLFHKESEEDAAEESSGRTLKLFGTTLLVTDTYKPSATTEPCNGKPVAAKIVPWTGSNTSSVNDTENNEKSSEQGKSYMHHCITPSEKSNTFEIRVRPKSCRKGFVPYKRCMAEREKQDLTVTDQEREEKRIRLCL